MPLDSHASVIEKGVPMPSRKGFRYSELDSIIAQMEVGDSVLPARLGVKPTSFKAWAQRRQTSIKFSTRKTAAGYRVWRIA